MDCAAGTAPPAVKANCRLDGVPARVGPGPAAMMGMESVPVVVFLMMVSKPVRDAGSIAEIDVPVHDDTCRAVCVVEPTGFASTWQLVHWSPKSYPVIVIVPPELTIRPGALVSGPTPLA